METKKLNKHLSSREIVTTLRESKQELCKVLIDQGELLSEEENVKFFKTHGQAFSNIIRDYDFNCSAMIEVLVESADIDVGVLDVINTRILGMLSNMVDKSYSIELYNLIKFIVSWMYVHKRDLIIDMFVIMGINNIQDYRRGVLREHLL